MIGSSSETLKIVIKARDEASKTIKSVSDKAKKVAGDLRGVGAGMTVMGAGITAVMGKSVKAYQEQEIAEKRLEAIAKKVTGATDEEIEGFKKQARELQKVGVMGDEVVISGQSQLASFTKSASVVTELTDDLADLAVGTYGVNVSQEQSIQTANLMGKALSGQLGALTRTGVLVNDELKVAFEACNTEEERSVVLSQIIQDNYGGLNEEMRKTSAGGMQDVINSLGDIAEDIGEQLIPILTDLMEQIKPIIENTMKWMKENEELTKKIVIGVAIIGALMLVLGPLLIILPGIISAVGLLMGAFALILSPIGLVVIAIGLAILIGKKLIDNWDVFKASLIFIWDAIKTKASEIFESIKKIIIDTADKVIEAWSSLPENLGYLLGLIGRYIWEKWDEIRNFFREILPEIINGIVEWFRELPGKILEKLQSLLDTVRTKMAEIPGIVIDAVKGVKDKITQPFRDAADWVRNFKLPSIKMPDIRGGLSGWSSRIQSGFSSAFNNPFNDFISRPGSAPVAFSSDDTIIGVKNPAALGAGGVVINVNGGNYLDRNAAEKFAEYLGEKFRRELRH